MKTEIIRKLAQVAESLDQKGYFEESNFLDSIIEKIAKKPAKKPTKKPAKKKPAGEKPAKKDWDGDGKVESSKKEWEGSRDKAIKANK